MLRRFDAAHRRARPLRSAGRRPSVWRPESATARCGGPRALLLQADFP